MKQNQKKQLSEAIFHSDCFFFLFNYRNFTHTNGENYFKNEVYLWEETNITIQKEKII